MVSGIKKVREEEGRKTFEAEFDISGSTLTYKTMYDIAIFPENDPAVVKSFAASQGWNLDKPFILKYDAAESQKLPFPLPITANEALTKFCDLTGLVS